MPAMVTFTLAGVTQEIYDGMHAEISNLNPDGVLAHAARFEGGDLHVIDFWESAAKFETFTREVLGPRLEGSGSPTPTDLEITEIYNFDKF